jgi:hypothetical protein
MGSKTSYEILDTDLTLEEQLGWHLRGNHYPPAPVEMIPVCRDVILWLAEGKDPNQHFALPSPSTWRGESSAPAWAIADGHHLYPWIEDDSE